MLGKNYADTLDIFLPRGKMKINLYSKTFHLLNITSPVCGGP